MSRDNKDRYGYRHRSDREHDLGEAKPGDVGDSDGTFHDRAARDDNVIVDGEAKSYEKHKRSRQSQDQSGDGTDDSTTSQQSTQQTAEPTGQYAELDEEVVKVSVDRVSNSGNPIGTYRGMHVHIPGGDPGDTYEVELHAKSGYFVGDVQSDE